MPPALSTDFRRPRLSPTRLATGMTINLAGMLLITGALLSGVG